MTHPYDLGGAPRVWFLASRAIRLLAVTALLGLLYLITPTIPWQATADDWKTAIAEATTRGGIALTTATLLVALGLYYGLRYAAGLCDREAISTIPGAYAWRTSLRDPDLNLGASVHRRTYVPWIVLRTLLEGALTLAIAAKGALGALLVIYLFASMVTIALARRATDRWSTTATSIGCGPAAALAILVLHYSFATIGFSAAIPIATAAAVGLAAGLGYLARTQPLPPADTDPGALTRHQTASW